MSKGKKQLLTVIGLLLLLAAMVCAYVFVPKGESDTSDEDGTKDTAANTVEVINIEKKTMCRRFLSRWGQLQTERNKRRFI